VHAARKRQSFFQGVVKPLKNTSNKGVNKQIDF
jgi:hypothetical protein